MPAFPSNHYKVLDGLVKAAVLFSAYVIVEEEAMADAILSCASKETVFQ